MTTAATATATKNVRLSVNMNSETASALRQIAENNGISVTEAVRRVVAIAAFIEDETRAGHKVQVRDNSGLRELVLM